jgi:hypothetical protein
VAFRPSLLSDFFFTGFAPLSRLDGTSDELFVPNVAQ